jgi:hypothetical protein
MQNIKGTSMPVELMCTTEGGGDALDIDLLQTTMRFDLEPHGGDVAVE